jgi:tetratricopeptide (TPR) repeat protein
VRYRAFLSYSHNDAHWARWLLRKLEGYRVPSRLVGTPGRDGPIPARLGAMFRDRDELPTAGDLSGTIRDALSESTSLIVICSPAAARSQWVDAEVRTFLEQGRGDRVLCFIVEGEPTVDNCFPPATIENGREPLAADARKEGDGRERAFLKLVAGMLGVGFDALVQREVQRRHRRLAWVAAASVAGMAIASTLAVAAYVARNDAQRRQAQAEDLLGFMLGDLREKLTTVGRLDLMRKVDDKATLYFAELDPRDLSDRALQEQARSLTGIGQVRLEEGHHPEAARAFSEAYARTSALYDRKPQEGQRLFDRAQAEYWIGYVAWQQDRFDDAERWLRQYRDSAVQLAAMDRKNFDWQKEVAYGHHNLAVLQESRGKHADAEHAMKRELALFRQWIDERPTDHQLRFEAATVVSWLGTNAEQQGRYEEAEAYFKEEIRDLTRLRRADPDNVKWREEWVDAQLLLAGTSSKAGDFAQAHAATEAANREADALVKHDPTNRKWQAAQGIARYWRAQLASTATPKEAVPIAREAEVALAAVHAAEPKDARVNIWLERTRKLQGQLAQPAMAAAR